MLKVKSPNNDFEMFTLFKVPLVIGPLEYILESQEHDFQIRHDRIDLCQSRQ